MSREPFLKDFLDEIERLKRYGLLVEPSPVPKLLTTVIITEDSYMKIEMGEDDDAELN